MHVLTDNQGRPLNGTNSFGEPITYAVTRFRHDGTLALMAVYNNPQGEEQSYPLSTNLAAYGYCPKPQYTFIDSAYLDTVKPLIVQGIVQVIDTVRYGQFNSAALQCELLIENIDSIND